ncbi:Rieske [2Fe-2S] domain-containing protein [Calothrix sp. NIES-2100]|uniref:aromatic ring-hydroxylating dioxygenase subunit alpha n=1 Tax=Calothrix sp. NIES-2100 TaxID=1954172 RepID=UPI000B5E2BFF|nr:Rieske [2Fe-2S] domain-containing protein [Calothrix sp. NIES-2100]
MTLEIKTPEATPPTDTFHLPEAQQEFNWKQCWYPVCFQQDLPKNRSYSFSLYDEPFVLFTNQEGQLICLTDRCPHRAAKLSDGQIIDGKIECLYHGWQFGINGECLHIPQLPSNAKIPSNACVASFKVVERQGIIWMWAGESEAAIEELIPTLADVDKPGFVHTDKITDLPYEQSYFIENVLDPAHVNISHDGSQGNRNNAQPLEMEVIESSVQGFRGRFRNTREPDDAWRRMDFIAPNLVLFQFTIEQKGWNFGLALYSFPLGKNRCRVLTRSYRNFVTWEIKLKPRWLIHFNQSKILEEDLSLVVGQQAEIQRLGKNLQDVYLPLKTSDAFVIEYRKWLDRFGAALPFYQGYSTSKNVDIEQCDRHPVEIDRYLRHTQLCNSCNRTYQVTNSFRKTLIGLAIALAFVAILADDSRIKIATVSTSLLVVALAAVAQQLKTKFERAYTRH